MSSLQFNLLPDVKLKYLKAQRQRSIMTSVAVVVTVISIAVLLLTIVTNQVQKKRISNLSSSITAESQQLQRQPDINKVLTVQNQLMSLTQLHNSKPAASRLFTYLTELTPANADISNLAVDFTQKTLTVTGTSDSLTTINAYVDALKAATYTSGSVPTATPAFSNVVLSSFGYSNSSSSTSLPATYTVTLSFDSNIFDIQQNVNLQLINSAVNRSSDLFTNSTTAGGTQ